LIGSALFGGFLMSYNENIVDTPAPNQVCYVGANDGTPLIVPGGIAVRLNPAAPNVLQFADNTGVASSFEAYNVVRFGVGARQGWNFNALSSVSNAWVWNSLDLDTMLTDGSDMQTATICMTADADSRLWTVTAWRPTPTKCVLIAKFDNTGSTVDGTVEGMIAEHQRITVSDSPTPLTTFNGRQYSAADGWIPSVAGRTQVGAGYTSHGTRWSLRPTGIWGLVSDSVGGTAPRSHTLDLVFRRYPPGIIRRFGDFQ
jgi:hypothetical protein